MKKASESQFKAAQGAVTLTLGWVFVCFDAFLVQTMHGLSLSPLIFFSAISAMSGLAKRVIGAVESGHVNGMCANFSVALQDGNKLHLGFQRK